MAEAGRVTSQFSDLNLVIPGVETSAMARAQFVQYQAMIDFMDSILAQQAFTSQTVQKLATANDAIEWVPRGEFNPADKIDGLQAYLDLLAGGIADASLGPKTYAGTRSSTGQSFALPYPPVEVDISEQAGIMNLPVGQFSSVSIAGGARQYWYRAAPSPDDPMNIPAPVQITPDWSRAPDGSDWISTTLDAQGNASVPLSAPPGSYLKLTDSQGEASYYRVAVNGLAMKLDMQDGLILFAGSMPAEQVDALRSALLRLQNTLTEQSKVQALYLQMLMGQLFGMVTAVSDTVQRIRHSAKVIIDRGIGGG